LSGAVDALHGAPQLPQLLSSVCVLTQAAVFPVVQSCGKLASLHEATQLAPMHIKVPFVGAGGQEAHLLLQAISPEPQGWHTPPEQLPEGQIWPQVPQLFLSFDVSISQPLAALPSQLAKPDVHTTLHRELTHEACA
jgi:hypothetical protein